MLKALYYPFTQIDNPTIIKNALLLWDEIETIVPEKCDLPWHTSVDHDLEEATEIIVRPRVPIDEERRAAHIALMNFLKNETAKDFIKDGLQELSKGGFSVYDNKFLGDTWHELLNMRLAKASGTGIHCVPPMLGFLMISLLADSCAGTQIQKITDRAYIYKWITEYYAAILGSKYLDGSSISEDEAKYDRLITLSLELLDAREIPLKKLIEFRKREARSGGTDFSSMRRRYSTRVQSYLERIGKEAKTQSDLYEIQRQFKEDMKRDLAELKDELKLVSLNTLFSKEVAVPIIFLAGCFIAPNEALQSIATNIGWLGTVPLIKGWVNYRGARRIALQKHAMSWLYLANQPRLATL